MKSEASFAVPARALALLLGFVLLAATTLFAGGTALAKKPAGGVALPVTGELEDGGTFEGTVSDLDAGKKKGDVVVSGVLEGTATTADGETRQVSQDFSTPATLQQGDACDILFLDLGPIFLDLLGLTVDLSPIQLDVNAVPGAGNLLGNLLCALTGLLDGPGALAQIVGLLDRIFDIINTA